MLKGRPPKGKPKPLATCEQNRDIYGFMVRPQHLERYREHATIYKEEETERSDRWEQFLSTINENAPPSPTLEHSSSDAARSCSDGSELEDNAETAGTAPKSRDSESGENSGKYWGQLRKALWPVERASSIRGRGVPVSSSVNGANSTSLPPGHNEQSSKRGDGAKDLVVTEDGAVPPEREAHSGKLNWDGSGEDSDDEFCDATEGTDFLREAESGSPTNVSSPVEAPWEEELRSLVRGGVPMALRGELWQVFVGTKKRRIRGHYNALLTLLGDGGGDSNGVGGILEGTGSAAANFLVSNNGVLEKWTNQIEKDLPRTFPGHPALDEDGRNTLRRLLTAYARHNPSVGYCQAMNFLAGLLLLLMPEENAFWTLTGIIEDNFEGYYSEKMVEAQVDQLIFDELVREKFPKLVSHLDALGVQVAWVSGPWFLSMFVNILPWESVLRVWDVLLYEGNRCMLFRTGLALMEIHAPSLSATRDAGDAVAMLQSMATDTFDSSQLVLMACMGFQAVTESRLQELHLKHRPTVWAALQERSIELHLWRNSNCAITEKLPYLYSVEGSGDPLLIKRSIVVSDEKRGSTPNGSGRMLPDDVAKLDQPRGVNVRGPVSFEESSLTKAIENITPGRIYDDHSDADAEEQVAWLKNELSRALEEKKAALLRATELETAFMLLAKEDNRRLLSARVEQLEAEVGSLKQQLSDKKEQEQALVQVLVRMEQEQKIADDARRFAELDSTAQRRAAEVFQEKYEGAADALGEMEKRAVMAESMLEATLSYQALGTNSPNSSGAFRPPVIRTPDSANSSSSLAGTATSKAYMNGTNGSSMHDYDDHSSKQGIFNRSFGLNWRDRSKARSSSLDSPAKTPAQPAEHAQDIVPASQPPSELSVE